MALTKATPDVLSKAYVEKTDDTQNVLGGTIALTEKIFTISSGAVTPTRSNIVLAAQSGTADILDQIVTTSLSDDSIIILSVDTGDTITINDAGGAAGQIHLADNADLIMSGDHRLCLVRDGADWYECWRTNKPAGSIIQTTHTQVLAARQVASGSAVVDDSIPQLSECPVNVDFDTAFTPTNASNIILVEAGVWVSHTAGYGVLCLFTDAETGATAATADYNSAANVIHQLSLVYKESAGSTTARTYKLGFGNSAAGNIGWNGAVAGTRVFGGVGVSSLRISEIQV